MELRSALKLTIAMAAGAAAFIGVANAAPLAPASSLQLTAPQTQVAEPALVSKAEADQMKPQEVRWHRGWHRRHWHHRHWRRHWR